MNASDFVKHLQRMIAVTDTGLTFTKDPFDRERYEDLRSLLSKMLNQGLDIDSEEVAEVMTPTSAYATPLMDVRAWIVEDEKICLVRGQGEDSWALPGGFGEVGCSPTENILKEIEEETGSEAKVERLLAVFDTNRFQLQSKQYAKFVFECKFLNGQFQENQEIADLQFFAIDQLPVLSEKRITKEQIEILWQVYQGQREQYLD